MGNRKNIQFIRVDKKWLWLVDNCFHRVTSDMVSSQSTIFWDPSDNFAVCVSFWDSWHDLITTPDRNVWSCDWLFSLYEVYLRLLDIFLHLRFCKMLWNHYDVLHIALHIFPCIWYMESLSICFFCFTQCRLNLDCNLHFIWFFERLFVLFFRWTLTLGANNEGQIQTLSQPKPINKQADRKETENDYMLPPLQGRMR